MCDARLFAPQVRYLRQKSFVADLSAADNIPELSRRVLANAPPEFAIVGLSMGGILAFELWRQSPERITHMALMDTSPHADAPDRRTIRINQIARVLEGKLREVATEELKPLYLAKKHRDDSALLDTLLQMAIDLGPEVFTQQSLALKDRPDSVATLARITCPTTIICGREDSLCPVEFHELMASTIPGARLVILDDCGHMATLEQPDSVNRELQELFDQ